MKPWGATFEEAILNLKNHPLIHFAGFQWLQCGSIWGGVIQKLQRYRDSFNSMAVLQG